ncbi:lytic polysaccharide monooxygenase auxiliary activity family 9 protein [Streptomyces coffeae]|uniref:Lytic polysaccharide monooxygenase n=1 Tax=Streptomyces coffeae TaxID=621382 RepID=A0ABS1NIC1_9ACTN|nr:lytic polysaccharide monooxygenase [Streptomyces coffeae]MBL1099803.1 lytic polysaccharide monooxygenase [Streptomyces coffeae]
MTARRQAARIAALGVVPLALTTLSAAPATAHGSMQDPVSRVSACYAEGPENPRSAACKAAVAAMGTQPLYDWNEVNIADAAGKSKQIIPDGKLCSAGREKYKGLDLPRAEWPATAMKAGTHTFTYRATAPHKGSFELYITKDGYNPTKRLTWSDLEAKPFAKVTDPTLKNGSYVFTGTVPKKSGRHLIYSIWQRSDSPEAFYTCSDVTFGGAAGAAGAPKESSAPAAPAPKASAPSDAQIAEGAEKSTVDHHGHGDHKPKAADAKHTQHGRKAAEHTKRPETGSNVEAKNAKAPTAINNSGDHLAQTGGDDNTTTLAIGGAAVLAAGAAVLFTVNGRRRAARRGRG